MVDRISGKFNIDKRYTSGSFGGGNLNMSKTGASFF